jgi:hypothetical protein
VKTTPLSFGGFASARIGKTLFCGADVAFRRIDATKLALKAVFHNDLQ